MKKWEKKSLQLSLSRNELRLIFTKAIRFQEFLEQNIDLFYDIEHSDKSEFINKLRGEEPLLNSSLVELFNAKSPNFEEKVFN